MKERSSKIATIVLAVIVLYLTYILVQPYLKAIITAALLAYIFHPIYRFIEKKVKRKNFAAGIMLIIILIIVILPFLFILNSLLSEIPSAYNFVYDTLLNSDFINGEFRQKLYTDFGVTFDLNNIFQSTASSLLNIIQEFLTSIPAKLLNLSIAGFFMFFFFRDGYGLTKKITYHLPFSEKDSTIILRELKKTTDAVVYGQLVTAILQGIAATIAYSLLGVSAPLFWGVMTLIGGIIPMIGPGFIYWPLSLTMIAVSYNNGDSVGIVKGIILLVYSLAIVSSIDNIVKPLVIGDKVKLHPAIVLLGVVGGLTVFGIVGIVLGPLIMVFAVTIFNLYEMKEELFDHLEHPKEKKQ